ncbi:MAG TPA: DUF3079 domain-containing protein [Candidatus Binatia bacterium]|jgi:hypothetical protein
MKAAFLHPKHPDRTCWGCDRLCPANDLGCGNGTVRTQHPVELFGDDWLEFAEARQGGIEGEPDRSDIGPEFEGNDPDTTEL